MRACCGLLVCLALAACQSTVAVLQSDFDFDGTCVRCHAGLGAHQVHPSFKLRCVDCHGGDDQVLEVPEQAFEDAAVYRNPALLGRSHVAPAPELARFFLANGIDDDEDGSIDESITIEDAGTVTTLVDTGEIAELGLHGLGPGEYWDTELNRDLNYLRWLNPGDLRVATIGCGASARPALDSDSGSGSGCHQRVVDTMRRSIMTTQAPVVSGAYYANESWRAAVRSARDDQGAAQDPRRAAFAYVLDYQAIDDCIDTTPIAEAADDPSGRAQPRFDRACMRRAAAAADPAVAAGAPGNTGLPAFEVAAAALGPAPGAQAGRTLAHESARDPGVTWGGNPIQDPAAALPELEPIPNGVLTGDIPDPMDAFLRGARVYASLDAPGAGRNATKPREASLVVGAGAGAGTGAHLATSNPFGRGRSTGCTSCHMLQSSHGAREPQAARAVAGQTLGNGTVVDPTTRHRELDPDRHDVILTDAGTRLAGMTVTASERQRADNRDQQRFYSARHQITTQVTTQQCGLCHGVVTRHSLSYQGMAVTEQRDVLARRAPIRFTTPAGTPVIIHDALVREERDDTGVRVVVPQEAAAGIEAARQRDAQLTEMGLEPGKGGCAPAVYTEDCNNNGELDRELVLRWVDENGRVRAEVTVDEDLDQDGVLDLIDRAPREDSVDGQQPRYVYGGANGSTRLMDIHFERGMHCIDCHMLQDVHGDGNLYSHQSEAVEIECEDCHGTLTRASLVTSGANGGNDLRRAVDGQGRSLFVDDGQRILQRSRVIPGLYWQIPQVVDVNDPEHPRYNPRAVSSHDMQHIPASAPPGAFSTGSTFSGEPGHSGMLNARLECYACHSSWVHACVGCHQNTNLGDRTRLAARGDGTVERVAGGNEAWHSNAPRRDHTELVVPSFVRSLFVLGYGGHAESHRLTPMRPTAQAHVSVSDESGHSWYQNLTFTTFQAIDANTGRTDVATSGGLMNPTVPHTVRPLETRGCEQCHALVDPARRVQNDHVLAEALGLGAGRYAFTGDWVVAAGAGGIELFDIKQEHQYPGRTPGASTRFPGLVMSAGDRVSAQVEPVLDGSAAGMDGSFVATDVALIRNFQPAPRAGQLLGPSLRDLAVTTAHAPGTDQGRLVISDVTHRGHPMSTRPSIGDGEQVFVLPLPDAAHALTHLGPDVSDPYIYIASGAAGLTVVELADAPSLTAQAARITAVTAIPAGHTAIEVAVAGKTAYVGTAEGTLEIFDLTLPATPTYVRSFALNSGAVRGIAIAGFVLYAATASGLAVVDIAAPAEPRQPSGAEALVSVPGIDARELFYAGGHVYVAAGDDGVLDIDMTTPTQPEPPVDLVAALAPGQRVTAVDVIVSHVPGQTWLLVADASGGLVGLKLDGTQSTRERCLPDPKQAGCHQDMDWRDPLITSRDPSYDPHSRTFDSADPSAPRHVRWQANIVTAGMRLARPAAWDRIATHDGRRYRDSMVPGAGVLPFRIMRRMYGIQVCEDAGTPDTNGNGYGLIGLAKNSYFATGECEPLADVPPARPPSASQGASAGADSHGASR